MGRDEIYILKHKDLDVAMVKIKVPTMNMSVVPRQRSIRQ